MWIFILATVGLLSYAAVRPWIDQWAEVRRSPELKLQMVRTKSVLTCRRERANGEITYPCQAKQNNEGEHTAHFKLSHTGVLDMGIDMQL